MVAGSSASSGCRKIPVPSRPGSRTRFNGFIYLRYTLPDPFHQEDHHRDGGKHGGEVRSVDQAQAKRLERLVLRPALLALRQLQLLGDQEEAAGVDVQLDQAEDRGDDVEQERGYQ